MARRLPALLLAVTCLLLALAGCASPATPEVAPAAPTYVAPTAVVAQREATVAPPPTPTPAPTARTGSPAAKLSRQAPDGECRRVIYMYLTGFAPDSAVTVDGSYDELVCGTGALRAGHWTKVYPDKTDATGRLMVSYDYDGTGSYWMPIQSTGPDDFRNSAS